MKSAKELNFPYAEQVVGYRLSQTASNLAKRVEDANKDVVEIIEVWSGSVQRVLHIGAGESADCIRWSAGEAFFERPNGGTVMTETDGNLSVAPKDTRMFHLQTDIAVHCKNGLHHMVIRRVRAGRRVGSGVGDWGDVSFLAALILCASAGALFAMMVVFAPQSPSLDAYDIDDRFAHIMLLKDKVKEVKPRPKPSAHEPIEASDPSDDGVKVSNRKSGGNGERFGDERANNLETVRKAGLLGALNRGGVLSNTAIDDGTLKAIGGIPNGQTAGSSYGLGSRKGGLGKGPGADGSMGTLQARLGTDGAMSGSALCKESGLNCSKGDRKLMVTTESNITIGSLSKSDVDEVIKNNINRIKYCYQKEAQRDLSLHGRVVSSFTIGKDGSVSTARIKDSSMSSGPVERCLVKTIFRLQFPKPRGGGVVFVTYPFTFQSV